MKKLKTMSPEAAVQHFWPQARLVSRKVTKSGLHRSEYLVVGYRIRPTIIPVPWADSAEEAFVLAVENMEVPDAPAT